MKKRLLPFIFLFVITIPFSQAQNPVLWGMTSMGGGGGNGDGIIFKTDTTGSAFKTSLYFYTQASNPMGDVIQASNELLYGMTPQGGKYDSGVIFSYNITTGVQTDVHDFGGGTDGQSPYGSLIQAGNGLLYGMTCYGGANGIGTIFNYNILTGSETVLHNFGKGNDGLFTRGSLIQAKDSLLYGMTAGGGVNGEGTIFSYNISTGLETDLYDFGSSDTDGQLPQGSLIQAKNGLFYGMTAGGGVNGEGTIFSYNISTGTETDIHDFYSYSDNFAFNPNGSLIQANNGLLYGMTYGGGYDSAGTIFSCDTNGILTDLHDFAGDTTDASSPWGSLIQASNGQLYGMAGGGAYNYGAIFSYNISSNTELIVHNFIYHVDGWWPFGSLIQAQNGLLYGMTSEGGANNFIFGDGILLSYNITTEQESDIFNFGSSTNGNSPQGSLLLASNGLLYGMTLNGGNNRFADGDGVLFSYNRSTDSETVLHEFGTGIDGKKPYGSLIQVNDSLLYGMTDSGGLHNNGTIFSYNISSGTETVLHNFKARTDGSLPSGTLLQVGDTLLYGMTSVGGTYEQGVIFSYNISNGVETVLHNFGSGTDGQVPGGSLILADNGLLYGLTGAGGVNEDGTIFSYDISTRIETDLHDFGDGTDGAVILYGSLIQANDSSLYGMTIGGGTHNYGTIFGYDISSGKETDLHDFGSGTDGTYPWGSLIQASDGLLYGMTSEGGDYETSFIGLGTIFNYNIFTGMETVIHYFTDTDGAFPYGDLIQIDTSKKTNISQISINNNQLSIYPNPSSDYFYVNLTQQQRQPVQLSLYNILGQQVYSAQSNLNPTATVPVTGLPDGVYVLKVNEGNSTQQKEIIVTR